MTAAPNSPLVERVAKALYGENACLCPSCTREAQAALAACEAEGMRDALRQSVTELEEAARIIAGFGLRGTASIMADAVGRKRALLARLDGKLSGNVSVGLSQDNPGDA